MCAYCQGGKLVMLKQVLRILLRRTGAVANAYICTACFYMVVTVLPNFRTESWLISDRELTINKQKASKAFFYLLWVISSCHTLVVKNFWC
jgi:hypothetical protein